MKRNIIEIDTFLSLYNSSEEIKRRYLEINDLLSMKEHELQTLHSLFLKLSKFLSSPMQKMGYLIDESAECGIKEQFDVLRFSDNMALNIELKYSLPKHGLQGILYQLQRHEHLLKNIHDNVSVFCYIQGDNILYQLIDSTKLEKVSFDNLADLISDDYNESNLLDRISSSSILISPYTEPQKFIESKYFLSDEQRDLVNKLIKEEKSINAVLGGPGTGKSLVLFELAKYYVQCDKKVLFIFSAKFDDSNFSSYFTFDFSPIKDVKIEEAIIEYDVILVDEAQRLWKNQIESLIKSKKVIFAADHRQVLRFSEQKLGVEAAFRNSDKVSVYELKEKVRTDKQLASFIKHFFNKKSKDQLEEYSKINAVYFKSDKNARKFIEKMREHRGYTPIELTEYRKYRWNKPDELYRRKISSTSKNQFEVIGREYDKVLVVIDESAKYDDNGKLILIQKDYDYIEENGLFEAMTRVREQLLLVFVGNENMFIQTSELLNVKTKSKEKEKLRNLLTMSQNLEENLIEEGTLEKNEYVATNRKLRAQVGISLKNDGH